MTKPTTLPFSKLLIMVGNGASPEVFSAPCGLTTKGIDISASSNTVAVPDCDNPDLPVWDERVVKGLSGKITGSGVLAKESYAVWRDWALAGSTKSVRVKLDSTGMGYYAGRYILSSFNTKANLGDKIQVDISLDNDGEITWVAV